MYKLCIEDDEGQQTIVPIIRDEITIGRKEGNTIRLTERNVSRQHAKLVRQNGQLHLEDVSARYGVIKNGQKIAQRADFREGDVFLIGDYRLTLMAEVAPGAKPPAPAGSAAPASAPPSGGFTSEPTHVSRRPEDSARRSEGTEILPSIPAKLVIVSSNFAGQEFPLTRREMAIGRGEDCDIIIDHRSVSQRHAKIVREATGTAYQIVDLNSKNGVRIGNEKYTAVHLKRGDIIELGHVKFRFVEPGENYVFVPQAADDDEPRAGGGGDKKLLIGGVVLLLLLVSGVVFAISQLGDEGGVTPEGVAIASTAGQPTTLAAVAAPEPEPEASNPKIAEGINKARGLLQDGEIDKAVGTLEALDYAEPSAQDKQLISKLLSQARHERPFQEHYVLARTSAAAGRHMETLQAIYKIPEHSIFAAQVDKQGWKTDALKGVQQEAMTALEEGNPARARALAEEIRVFEPEDPGARDILAAITQREDERAQAALKVERAKPPATERPQPTKPVAESLSREEVDALIKTAQQAVLASKPKEALRDCSAALKAMPGASQDCHRVMGMAYRSMGDTPKACKSFNKALNTNPPNAPAIQNMLNSLGCKPD